MCGIAGLWSEGGTEAQLLGITKRMTDRLRTRGPDDSGGWCDPEAGLALGHRRLSILDLSPLGHQPMTSADGRWVVSYNGEIYNYRDVSSELAAGGARFRSTCDTEVLVEAIAAWGVEAALRRIAGMFAFAAWDRSERRLFLARDRLGIKPLYYGWWKGTLLFGSELKALTAFPGFAPDLSRDAIALLLRHCYIPAPHTVYQGIYKLPAGNMISCDEHAAPSAPRCWWSAVDAAVRARRDAFTGDANEAVHELGSLMQRIVQEHLMSDVPLGAFLSGGIDSSTVVALMQAQSTCAVKTFTIGFHEDAFDEACHAREVARHLGTDHTELYLSASDAAAVIPDLPEFWDEPYADSSQIPTYLVSRLARQSVKVSLSGDGGDELFGGYSRYQGTLDTWKRLPHWPASLRRIAARIVHGIPSAPIDALGGLLSGSGMSRRGSRLSDSVRYRADILAESSIDGLYRFLVSYWPEPDRIVLGAHEPRTAVGDSALALDFEDPIERMMLADTLTYLPEDILTKVDRASMAVSLEARVPLLDHRLYEFAWSLPLGVRIRDGQTKWPLRQILAQHIPRGLFERPKQGFGVPIVDWLRGPLRGWSEELLGQDRLRREGVFEPATVRATWSQYLQGHSYEPRLWILLMFQAWLDHHQRAGR